MNQISVNLQNISEQFPELIIQALNNSSNIVANEAKAECLVDTGTLQRSVDYKVDDSDFTSTIGTNVEYSEVVHEKYKPFLQMAFDNKMQDIRNEFEGLLER